MSRTSIQKGFTLVELMVALAVLAILAAASVPSFLEFRERSVARGAADQIVSYWASVRFEAIKQNRLVRVTFDEDASGQKCVGADVLADTTSNRSSNTACDCFATSGTSVCTLSRFPADQSEWRSAQWVDGPTHGDSDSGVLIIDPRNGFLTQGGDAGYITVGSANASKQAQLRVRIDAQGRPDICEPDAAVLKLPEYADKGC